jgi:hypothetical protein
LPRVEFVVLLMFPITSPWPEAPVSGSRKLWAGPTWYGTARGLAEAGCSALVITAVTGHLSLREVARYNGGRRAAQIRAASRRSRPWDQRASRPVDIFGKTGAFQTDPLG